MAASCEFRPYTKVVNRAMRWNSWRRRKLTVGVSHRCTSISRIYRPRTSTAGLLAALFARRAPSPVPELTALKQEQQRIAIAGGDAFDLAVAHIFGALAEAESTRDHEGIRRLAQAAFAYSANHGEGTFGAGVEPIRRRGFTPHAARSIKEYMGERLADEYMTESFRSLKQDGIEHSKSDVSFARSLCVNLADYMLMFLPHMFPESGRGFVAREQAAAEAMLTTLFLEHHMKLWADGNTLLDADLEKLGAFTLIAYGMGAEDAKHFFAAKTL